jgi:prefoldin subunit 5
MPEQHLETKIPELSKSLALIEALRSKGQEPQFIWYALADNIYARAEIETKRPVVNLWLGANVMLEYTYDEATEFLSTSIAKATTEFGHVKADISCIRDQIVTSEVQISRIYNWDVLRRKQLASSSPETAITTGESKS